MLGIATTLGQQWVMTARGNARMVIHNEGRGCWQPEVSLCDPSILNVPFAENAQLVVYLYAAPGPRSLVLTQRVRRRVTQHVT